MKRFKEFLYKCLVHAGQTSATFPMVNFDKSTEVPHDQEGNYRGIVILVKCLCPDKCHGLELGWHWVSSSKSD